LLNECCFSATNLSRERLHPMLLMDTAVGATISLERKRGAEERLIWLCWTEQLAVLLGRRKP
jgi:hypothetical protein